MPTFELKILGGFELFAADGREISIRSKNLRALIAYLALNADRPHEREMLAGLLWGDRFEAQARQSLRQALLTIRTRLGDGVADVLDADSRTVTWNSAAARVDAIDFERHSDAENMEAAAAIYRGELLAGLNVSSETFNIWLLRERAKLNELACDGLQRLGGKMLESGDGAAAIVTARRAIELEGMREPGHRLLMSAFAVAGRHAEALVHYQVFVEMLQAELGAEPDGETVRLFDAIRAGKYPPTAGPAPQTPGAPAPPAALDRPSIAVLPFANLSGDQSQDYFVDGLSLDIVTALSKSRRFFVTARGSTMGYKDAGLDVKQIARELGVRYVVEGSVRVAGERMRVTAQLIDAQTGRHVWAEHHDGDMRDVFAVQDEIADRIAAAILPEYLSAEIYRVQRKEERNFDAWDLFMRAYWHLSLFTRSDMAECRRLCHAAIKLDAKGAGPYSLIAVTHAMDALYDWGEAHEQSLLDARQAALQAVGLDDHDPLALRCLAIVDFWAKRHDDALHTLRRALDLDPHDAEHHVLMGNFLGMSGDYAGARGYFDRAIQLNPRNPFMATWYSHFAMVAMVARRHEEAAEWARISIRLNPKFPGSYRSGDVRRLCGCARLL